MQLGLTSHYLENLKKSNIYYKMALTSIQPLMKQAPEAHWQSLEVILKMLGVNAHHEMAFESAEGYYKQTISAIQEYGKQDVFIQLSKEAPILNILGLLYHNMKNHKQSETNFIMAIEKYKAMNVLKPNHFSSAINDIQTNLANLYRDMVA